MLQRGDGQQSIVVQVAGLGRETVKGFLRPLASRKSSQAFKELAKDARGRNNGVTVRAKARQSKYTSDKVYGRQIDGNEIKVELIPNNYSQKGSTTRNLLLLMLVS